MEKFGEREGKVWGRERQRIEDVGWVCGRMGIGNGCGLNFLGGVKVGRMVI
jgi:hypothetical protein